MAEVADQGGPGRGGVYLVSTEIIVRSIQRMPEELAAHLVVAGGLIPRRHLSYAGIAHQSGSAIGLVDGIEVAAHAKGVHCAVGGGSQGHRALGHLAEDDGVEVILLGRVQLDVSKLVHAVIVLVPEYAVELFLGGVVGQVARDVDVPHSVIGLLQGPVGRRVVDIERNGQHEGAIAVFREVLGVVQATAVRSAAIDAHALLDQRRRRGIIGIVRIDTSAHIVVRFIDVYERAIEDGLACAGTADRRHLLGRSRSHRPLRLQRLLHRLKGHRLLCQQPLRKQSGKEKCKKEDSLFSHSLHIILDW